MLKRLAIMIVPSLTKWLLPALTAIMLAGLSVPSLAQPVYQHSVSDEPRYKAFRSGNYEEALRELRPLAEQGDADAQTTVGLMYAYGLGVPKDYVQSARWFHLAAEQGDGEAQYNLGSTYGLGRGAPHDNVQAYKWLSLAVRQGVLWADGRRDDFASVMTPVQISEGERLAREWPKKRRRPSEPSFSYSP